MRIKSLIGATLAAVTMLGTALAVAGPASAATQAKPKPADGKQCLGSHDDEWPDWANGKPAGVDAGDNGGVYVWHTSDGWHLVVTHRGDDKKVFAGVIRTPGSLVDVHGVALERDDKVVVSRNDHQLAFRFRNYGHIDGLTFKTVCAPRLVLGFNADGHRLPANRVVVGHLDRHPERDPFTITRQT